MKIPSLAGPFVALAAAATAGGAPPAARPPNIIMILADDLGYGDLGVLGQKNFETPRLDRMAAEGIVFQRHYSGAAVCAPSRATMLTGQHTGHVWQRGNHRPNGPGDMAFRRDPEDITVARRLKDAGYHTAMIGKSALSVQGQDATLANDKGFDHFFGYITHAAAHRYFPRRLYRNGQAVDFPGNQENRGTDFSGDLFLRETLDYLDGRARERKPFFLHVALQQPHADLVAPAGLRDPLLGRFDEKPYAGGGYTAQTHPKATYAAMVQSVDQSVGRILDKLAELGLDENTVVLFSSDNGSHREGGYHFDMHGSNGSLRGGKRDLYEGGIRVPLIARWPGHIPPGRRTDHVAALWDFAPTALDLAGLPPVSGMDGLSYAPILAGRDGAQKEHDFLYWEGYEPPAPKWAVLSGKWKGIQFDARSTPPGPFELYDLEADPHETRNVADAHPDVVERLKKTAAAAHSPTEFFSMAPR